MEFKQKFSFSERTNESYRITNKYTNKIPIICEKNKYTHDLPEIKKTKYLATYDLTIGHFLYIIRQNINISPEKALFVFINNIIPPTSANMITLYENYKDDDGFLYFNYSTENTFG
jgi:GABA(A) receptor-associated protein